MSVPAGATAREPRVRAGGEPGPRRLLIVSPNFPPVDTADLHRVRLALPFLPEFGWEPRVLAVAPEHVRRTRDDSLLATVPRDVPVIRTGALPVSLTGLAGVTSLGIRAFPHLARAGGRVLREQGADLIFFSTTEFFCLPLARIWRRRHRVPVVVDLQDPWVGDYHERNPSARPPRKHRFSRPLHRILERWTAPAVSGIVAVSPSYHERMRERHPRIRESLCRTIPFSASRADFEAAARIHGDAAPGAGGAGEVRLVYAGVTPPGMEPAIRTLFRALADGVRSGRAPWTRTRVLFLGTQYAEGAEDTLVARCAREAGVADRVDVRPERRPYLETLHALRGATAILLLGTDDPDYTASKVFPCILSGRPILTLFRPESGTTRILRETGAADPIPLDPAAPMEEAARRLGDVLESMAREGFRPPETDWKAFAPYEAREMTRRMCELFDAVAEEHAARG